MDFLKNRRKIVNSRIGKLTKKLGKARNLAEGKACVYLIGSYGRGEASEYSDLDLFIVGRGTKNERELKNLDEILIKAELIEATRKLGFPEFSGDGEYLKHYTVDDLVDTLGTRDDDKTNTFTAAASTAGEPTTFRRKILFSCNLQGYCCLLERL